MNGQKERLMVLDMIAEGKITAEEAEQLFRAMEVPEEVPAAASSELMPPLSHLSQLENLSAASSVAGRSTSKELVAALKEAGIGHVTLSDVQELESNKLTAEYVREILALGLRPDGISEWLDLRAHDITPRYVRELREMGITDASTMRGCILPMSHIVGPIVCNELAERGYTLVIFDQINPITILEGIQKHRVSVFESVPIVFQLLLGVKNLSSYDTRSMKIAAMMGTSIPLPLLRAFQAALREYLSHEDSIAMSARAREDQPGDGFQVVRRDAMRVDYAFRRVRADLPIADVDQLKVLMHGAGDFLVEVLPIELVEARPVRIAD